VFRTLAVLAVRQVDHQTRVEVPLGLSVHDHVVDGDLGSIAEVPELGFPDDQRVGVVGGLTLLEAQHGLLAQQTVRDRECALVDTRVVEAFVQVEFLAVLLVPDAGVAVGESASLYILAGETHFVTLIHQGAKCQSFSHSLVDLLLFKVVFSSGFEHVFDDGMGIEAFRDGEEGLGDPVQSTFVEPG